jgi:hypothetical protein
MTILKQRNQSEPYAISEQIAHSADSLTVKVAQLQRHNNFLTRKMQLQPSVRVRETAKASAELLALWHLTGYRTGKRASLSMGMSEYTWYHARAFCMLGLIHSKNGFTTDDANEIATGLKVAAERLAKDPNALNRYLPSSRRVRKRV